MIRLKGLKKSYFFDGLSLEILKNIDMTVYEKEWIGIMGPSGSGKSTLLNILGCLDTPDEGQYLLNDEEITQKTDSELATIRSREIGFVFQNFNLIPNYTAIQNVALPLAYSGIPELERLKKARVFLEIVGLNHRLYHLPKQLSGGERQRIAIARALINNPSIILADEPTGNLDSESAELILGLLANIHEQGRTVILVTHDKSIANRADRIITLRDGRIVK